MFGFSWFKIAGLVALMALGAFIAHKFDKGQIEHQKGLLVAAELKHEKAVKDALIWATDKQKEYDNVALAKAQKERDEQQRMVAAAQARLDELRGHETELVRGNCLTYEFVRHLDAAISNRPSSTLRLPAGKSAVACAPVDAAAVERWLLQIIATCQANGGQLDNLIAFFRDAQAKR